MSIQLVLFVVAIIAFVAAVVCAGLAVYVYRTQDIPGVKADLAGELLQIAPAKGREHRAGGKKRRRQDAGAAEAAMEEQPNQVARPDDSLTAFGGKADDSNTVAHAADDSLTVSRPAAAPDDSLTKVDAAFEAANEPSDSQVIQHIDFKVTHKQVDVHSEDDIPANGKRHDA